MVEQSSSTSSGRQIIRKILAPAIRIWIGTQVDHSDDLAIAIQSSDRQILSGYIPSAEISAQSVIYKGLHFGAIHVVAQNIRTNGLRVLKGSAFRLLDPVPIDVTLSLRESDLTQSLQSTLLSSALEELIQQIIATCIGRVDTKIGDAPTSLHDFMTPDSELIPTHVLEPSIILRQHDITIRGLLKKGDRTCTLKLSTGLAVVGGQTITFDTPHLEIDDQEIQGPTLKALEEFSIDLGDTTTITSLIVKDEQLTCQGRILVVP